ncbi:MAG: hypothetical protein J1F18_04870 [Lachnospiraceae bacterium]|nr:hypothetical protein [Lachnospiraceae bacterium]
MFDLVSIILDGIYGILVAIVGLLMLFGPYEKFKESYPKAPSKGVVKALGAVITLCGIGLFIVTAMGII